MQEFLLLRDSAAIKALGHPLRLHLLEQLIAEPASVQQLADRLGHVHAKLFYHVKELERNGLVEVVGEQLINGITERFYRATARAFYLGQSVGQFTPAAQTVSEAVQTDLLRQRRERELQIDNRQVARDLVRHALKVQPGERVVLEGAGHQAELLEAMLLECRLAGAEAFVRLMSSQHIRELLHELDAAQLATAPPLTTFLYGHTDLWVSFDAVAETAAFADCDPAKVEAIIAGELQAYRLGPKRFAAVEIGYPTPERAAELGVPYGQLHDAFWRAISASSAELRAQGVAARERLLAAQPPVTLTSPRGTSLEFDLDKRVEPMVNDGTLDRAQVSERQLTDLTLPGGRICFTPIPESFSGRLQIGQYLHRGTLMRGLELEFRAGELSSWRADEGEAALTALLQLLGAPLCVAQLSLGLNPHVQHLTGYKLLDPVAANSLGVMLQSRPQPGSEELPIPFWFYAADVSIGEPETP